MFFIKEADNEEALSLALIALFVISLDACYIQKAELEKGVIEPGDKIGEMTVEQSTEMPYPNIWIFCENMPDELEPTASSTVCEVPLVSSLDIVIGWLAKETKFASNWDAMAWEMYIDGYQIDLESFDWFESDYIAKGEDNKARAWIITLKNLSPGKHTLRHLWRSEIAVDDGWNIYQPGMYEASGEFHGVRKSRVSEILFKRKYWQHPYTSEKANLDFLLYLPNDYGKDPQEEWPLIVYLHGAHLRGPLLSYSRRRIASQESWRKRTIFPSLSSLL